jgi:hypothetical protein
VQALKKATKALVERKDAIMLRLLMRPSNAVCDAMHITDEHERGMVRMLVNMLLLTALAVLGFVMLLGSF